MRAVRVGEPGRAAVGDAPEPSIQAPGDAIVRVSATAICGADLLPLSGHAPGFDNETILGHEFAGTVVETGPGVTRLASGARVVSSSTISDGTCAHCRAGRSSQCEGRSLFGYSGVYPRLDGGQAEYVRVPNADRCLLSLPDELEDERAVFLADILPTAFAAVERAGARPGDHVAVVGLGPVGLMAVMCAARLAASVTAVDTVEARRSLAAGLAANVSAVAPAEAEEAVRAASGGLGADLVVEAAGARPALDLALRLARGRGTVSVVGAHFEPDYSLNAGLMFERELSLRFHIGDPVADRERLMGLMLAGQLQPERTISHRLPLEQAPEGYALFGGHEASKVVLLP
jgi:threonine dehydrogenase-like Zn-dependent dehydrogenase